MKLKLIAFLIFLSASSFGVHKFYMSLTQIEYSEKQKAVQIIVRIFLDDLQTEMNSFLEEKIEIATDREPKNIDARYKEYLNKNLTFEINTEKKQAVYIGKEYKTDLVIFYLEIENIDTIQSLQIENKILNRSFEDQENIVKTKIYGQYKSVILNRKNEIKTLNF